MAGLVSLCAPLERDWVAVALSQRSGHTSRLRRQLRIVLPAFQNGEDQPSPRWRDRSIEFGGESFEGRQEIELSGHAEK